MVFLRKFPHDFLLRELLQDLTLTLPLDFFQGLLQILFSARCSQINFTNFPEISGRNWIFLINSKVFPKDYFKNYSKDSSIIFRTIPQGTSLEEFLQEQCFQHCWKYFWSLEAIPEESPGWTLERSTLWTFSVWRPGGTLEQIYEGTREGILGKTTEKFQQNFQQELWKDVLKELQKKELENSRMKSW